MCHKILLHLTSSLSKSAFNFGVEKYNKDVKHPDKKVTRKVSKKLSQ